MEDSNKTNKTEVKLKDKKVNPILERIKQNKVFFYGIPVLVVMLVFTGLFYFILPAINTYYRSTKTNQILDNNNVTIDRSITNMNKALSEEPDLRNYDSELTTYIPKDPKLGEVLNMIQTKAKDFNLESKVGVSSGPSRTTVGNIAKTDSDQKALFQSISSGEIYFKPKSLNKDINAVLMSIEVNVRGDKKSFLEFLNDAKNLKPLINLVFVEYNESPGSKNDDSVNISALLRFESYALKFEDFENTVPPVTELSSKDPSLQSELKVETFDWDQTVKEKIELNQTEGNQ